MYRCSRCCSRGEIGYIIYSRSKNKAGVVTNYYLCQPCNAARVQAYRATKSGALAARQAIKKYEATNNKRRRAWKLAKLYNPDMQPCVVCQSVINVHRHHPDVDKPKEIVFLCAYHHKQAHKGLVMAIP